MTKSKDTKTFKNALSYEADKEYIFKRSEKRAWMVAGAFGSLMVLSWVGMCLMMPLKETIPYVIQTDKHTGIPEVINAVSPSTLSANEALDQFFVNQYIQNRETYTYQTIQKTYLETQLYSNEQVRRAYLTGMAKPDSVDKVMKQGTVDVKVKSIINEKIGDELTATARIDKIYTDTQNSVTQRSYVVRLTYVYQPQTKLKLSYRLENPLGFYVTSYQIVEENVQ
ncbi:TPA: type IV secretion system protein [Yersinia enterocolitica]|nr:type IV secretion system protein [Yersinia enterocolitica]